MTERRRGESVVLGHSVAVPLLGAVCLTAALRPVFADPVLASPAVHPSAVVGLAWAGQLWYVRHSLDTFGVAASRWGEVFGLANTLTLVRGGLYAVVAGFVIVPDGTALGWVPALCYGTGAVFDRLDGVVARTVGEPTTLGTRLDMAFDTFGFVVAPLVAVLWGLLPVWYLSLSAARYVYLAGVYWRRLRGRPVFDRPDSDLGKYLAGVQMVFLTVALAPSMAPDLVWTLAPVVLAPSLAVFARDFLVVSGRLHSNGTQ